jgi:peptide methionine sulfoxide reductase MsrA
MERAAFGAGSFDTARASKERLQLSRFTRPIVTEIVAAKRVYPAEKYRQHHSTRHGDAVSRGMKW